MSSGTGLYDVQQWQTARILLAGAEDTLLADYKPEDLSDVVKAKMIGIAPATAIMMRGFGQNAANETCKVTISGWMNPGKKKTAGPGYRLVDFTAVLGNHSASMIPLLDGKWGATAATWFEVDTWTIVRDHVGRQAEDGAGAYEVIGPVIIDSAGDNHAADTESCILIPTLGYTHLLVELSGKDGTTGVESMAFGLIWRPIRMREVVLGFAG